MLHNPLQHRDDVFSYEKDFFCAHQRGVKHQQGCREGRPFARTQAWAAARWTFSFPELVSLSKKITISFFFFFNCKVNFLPFTTFLSITYFLLFETMWEIPIWMTIFDQESAQMKQTKSALLCQKEWSAISFSCSLIPSFKFLMNG